MSIINKSYIKSLAITASKRWLNIVFATIFTTTLTLGHLLSTYEAIDSTYIGKTSIAAYSLGVIITWLLVLFGLTVIREVSLRTTVSSEVMFLKQFSPRKFWLLTSLSIFICYLPIILLCQSVLSPDSWSSVGQVTGDIPLSNGNPLIFTTFVAVFLKTGMAFGGLALGLTLFSIAQSAVLSMIFAGVILWMRQLGIGKNGIVATFIFYAILPVNAIAGIIMWKDILFAGVGVLFLIILRQLGLEGDKFFTRNKVVVFITLAFLFCSWRSNGFYAYVIFLIIFLALNFRVIFNKRHLFILFTPVFLFLLYTSAISLLNRSSGGVLVVVPLQQIARTVKYHGKSISERDKAIINEILPFGEIKNKYDPNLSDPMTSIFNKRRFSDDEGKYIKLWFRLFMNYKKTYVAAFLYNAYGYVYPYHTSTTTTDILPDNDIHPNALKGYTDETFDHRGKLVVAEYESIITKSMPLINNIGLYSYIMIVGSYIAAIKNKRELIGVFSVLVGLFVSTVLGPVNGEFRYLYLFVTATPFILSSTYVNNPIKKAERKSKT